MQLKTSLRYLEDRWDDKIARGLDQPELLLTDKVTGLQVLTGSTESANAVAKRSSLLSEQPIAALEIEASGNTLAPNKVKKVQRPTGKALA
jgi:hypothetical protein